MSEKNIVVKERNNSQNSATAIYSFPLAALTTLESSVRRPKGSYQLGSYIRYTEKRRERREQSEAAKDNIFKTKFIKETVEKT